MKFKTRLVDIPFSSSLSFSCKWGWDLWTAPVLARRSVAFPGPVVLFCIAVYIFKPSLALFFTIHYDTIFPLSPRDGGEAISASLPSASLVVGPGLRPCVDQKHETNFFALLTGSYRHSSSILNNALPRIPTPRFDVYCLDMLFTKFSNKQVQTMARPHRNTLSTTFNEYAFYSFTYTRPVL